MIRNEREAHATVCATYEARATVGRSFHIPAPVRARTVKPAPASMLVRVFRSIGIVR